MTDNADNARMMVEFLAGLGHTRIGLASTSISYAGATGNIVQRGRGFRETLRAQGLAADIPSRSARSSG
jgi:DNA-binding LacI/PurR family transcriptional regulator